METSNIHLSKQKYNELDRLALQVRIDNQLYDEKIDIFALIDRLGIELFKYSEMSESQRSIFEKYSISDDACTACNKGHYRIFYNDKKPYNRIRFSLAHEIKHYIKNETDCSEIIEKEADHFARQLLAPKCLVMNYVDCDVEKISEVFGLSLEPSKYALEQAKKLKKIDNIEQSEEEKEFLNSFQKFHENK